MKLKLSYQKDPKHSELASCVAWANSSELYSVGDDQQILKWDFKAGDTTQVTPLQKGTYVTQIDWLPVQVGGARKGSGQSDLFVLTCTDGRYMLVSSSGRVEKIVEAHKGAVLGALWSHDGTALITNGEDGALKVWSRSGMLRTSLAQSASPVYSTSWSPDSDQVLYTSGKSLVIKPLQPSSKPLHWKAHDGVILTVDWSNANNTIISGGEDRKYKVWDSYGRVLYSSLVHDSPIASLSWSPDGEVFSVGAFNTLRLCDKTGWSHCLEKPSSGTVGNIAWSSDGTQFAGACGSGQVIFAQIVERRLEWHNLEAVVTEDNAIHVKDVLTDAEETLELHDRIIKVSLGWGHLVATTPLQGYIYNSRNWTTPVTFDLKTSAVSLLIMAERHFLMAENISAGIQIFSYEGRLVSTIKASRGAVPSLSPSTVSISTDTVAIRDKKDEKVIHIFDVATGKPLRDEQPLRHNVEVVCLSLSYVGSSSERQLAFIDRNSDLFLTLTRYSSGFKIVSLGGMVGSIVWNECTNMLAGIVDGRLAVWYHPLVAFTNKDLLSLTLYRHDDSNLTKSRPQLLQFVGNMCTLRRYDGAIINSSISPFPALLHQLTSSSSWEAAVKLCRFVKDPALWACLAGMATSARELNTTEIAYAAVDEIDKVHYIAEIKSLPSSQHRNAELALFSRQPQQAESIYLQAGLIYRAIQLNIDLFNWERALHLALKHKTHIDTVLAFREKYLTDIGCQETYEKFLECRGKVKIDWDTITAKIEKEEN